jgi:hypothetical protein
MLTSPTTAPLLSSALSGATWSTDDRTNVVAASDGSIVQVAYDSVFGTYIVQTLPEGKYLSYSGLRSAAVAVGEHVLAGEVIATSALSLHVVISDSVTGYRGDGTSYDPSDYFGFAPVAPAADTPDPAAAETVPTADVIPAGTYDDPTAVIPAVDPVTTSAATATPVLLAGPEPVPTEPSFTVTTTPAPSTSGITGGAAFFQVTPTPAPTNIATNDSVWTIQSTALEPAVPVPPAQVEAPAEIPPLHVVDQIVADALATPKSAAAPLAHQAKGAPVKGGLVNLISLPFWNDTLTRAFNTFLQVGLTSIGAGAAHLFTVSDMTSLKIAGGAAVISLIQSLIRATNQTASK